MNTQNFQKLLSELLADICSVESSRDRIITGIANDSRKVKSGDLFVAYPGAQPGAKMDGRNFITSAIENGAVAVLAEAGNEFSEMELLSDKSESIIPLFSVKNAAAYLGAIAAKFYNNPSKQLSVIGITGTNGKTSCSQFVAACLQMANKECGVIGTLGNGIYGHLQAGNLTTPEPIELQNTLAQMLQQGAKYVAMEVSSHGLEQERVKGIEFLIGLFTNLSQDHLDYHGTMENYANAKRQLFNQPNLNYAVLNVDDEYGKKWAPELTAKLKVYTYSTTPNKFTGELHTYVLHSTCNDQGITASIHTPWGDGVLHNPYLVGSFNLSNLLAVLIILNILEIPLEKALRYVSELKGVPGRMETFGGGNQPLVVVDYAHKPGALEQVLNALRQQCKGNLWCVFGCGGNRDKGKRPLMGKIAEQYADRIIITDDNPRHEERREIVADILQGLTKPQQAIVEHDRRRAIAHAIECAQAGDIVLIAGKGHESYQIIGNEKFPMSDVIEVQMRLAEKY